MGRFSLFNLVLTVLDPLQIGRNYVIFPVWSILLGYYADTKQKTMNGVYSVRDIVLRLVILLLAFGVILCTAVFMYIGFYYTYMPVTSHSRPAHMQFQSCDTGKGLCSYPQAAVSLTKKQQLLMVGQPYRVLLVIDMPESPVNQNLGMFLVCAEMRDQGNNLKAHSCRSAILHYKSTLFTSISTWIKFPLFLLGFREEKQAVEVELFTTFHDDDNSPVTDVILEIQSRHIEFYSVSLHITAHFTGLRYLMFHWPILSAAIGVCTNLFFIVVVCLLSWYHWNSEGDWIDGAKEKLVEISNRGFRRSNRTGEDESSSSVEEIQEVEDEDDDDLAKDEKKSFLFRRPVKKREE